MTLMLLQLCRRKHIKQETKAEKLFNLDDLPEGKVNRSKSSMYVRQPNNDYRVGYESSFRCVMV